MALVTALKRRFVVTQAVIPVGTREINLLKPRSPEDLISEEDFALDERLPYWADLWPSSQILAERIAKGQGSGRRLLELGCGLGLVSVCAMVAGFDVLATDYYAEALQFTRANAWRNLRQEPATRLVDWRALPKNLGVFDSVVAADVLYESPYATLVAQVIGRTLDKSGIALVADPGRVAAEVFVQECTAHGMCIDSTKVYPYVAGEVRQRITIYTLRRA